MSEGTPGLDRLNAMSGSDAAAALFRCCGVSRWAEEMAARRPFADGAALLAASEALWPSLTEAEWREAFTHHPKIGDMAGLRARFTDTRLWAAGEQSGSEAASEATLQALAAGNADYAARFGHIFIVCATGKSAGEMLALLRARLPNPPEVELHIAAEEQKKITCLRLAKLMAEA